LRSLNKTLVRFLTAEDGPMAVEYAVMPALIIVACIGAVTTVGSYASYNTAGNRYPAGS
jgi:pilus assembly protein Flp/PilA